MSNLVKNKKTNTYQIKKLKIQVQEIKNIKKYINGNNEGNKQIVCHSFLNNAGTITEKSDPKRNLQSGFKQNSFNKSQFVQ